MGGYMIDETVRVTLFDEGKKVVAELTGITEELTDAFVGQYGIYLLIGSDESRGFTHTHDPHEFLVVSSTLGSLTEEKHRLRLQVGLQIDTEKKTVKRLTRTKRMEETHSGHAN